VSVMTSSQSRRHRRASGAVAAVAVLTLLLSAVPAARAAIEGGEGPKEMVRALTDQVLQTLRNDSLNADQKQQAVENEVYNYVDFDIVSRLVLARNWRSFTPEQQKQFVQEFKRHLSVTYGNNVRNYHNERVDILGARADPGGDWTVQTKIIRSGGAQDIPMDYRLRNVAGTWKIIDIVIDNVSLIANFRSQFQDIVSNGGPERLLKLLKQANEKASGPAGT
jgi:phospholipid transport system substrate-binding protein